MSLPPESPGQEPTATAGRHRLMLLALAVGTLLMVGFSFLPVATGVKVALVLAVAGVEAFLVGGVLMHLLAERQLIYAVMALTAVFFLLLFLLPLLYEADGTRHFFP